MGRGGAGRDRVTWSEQALRDFAVIPGARFPAPGNGQTVAIACAFACHADVNAAINITAGHAVTARGGDGAARPVNREPQLLLQPA